VADVVADHRAETLCPPWTSTVEALEDRGLLEQVAKVVRSHYVTMYEACGKTRTKKVAVARHAAWKHLYGLGFSYSEIGQLWGVNNDSVLRALKGYRKRDRRKPAE
jgi:hypothetical protein